MTPQAARPRTAQTDIPSHSTMLELVQALVDGESSADAVVQTAAELIDTGAVKLTGNFRNRRLNLRAALASDA